MKTTRLVPWYMFPAVTTRVMNRIASRYETLSEVRVVLDRATEKLWGKIEAYRVA